MVTEPERMRVDAEALASQARRAPAWYRAISLVGIASSRFRAARYRLLGARLGPKCLFDARVRLDYPWRIAIGERTQLEADVWLKLVSPLAEVVVGGYSFLGRGVEIDVMDRVTLGAHVLVAPGVFITDHSHNIGPSTRIDDQGCTSRPVFIGDDVWLGARAVVLPGVTIGTGAVVGAGAVVRSDVAAGTVVAGVPARVLRRR